MAKFVKINNGVYNTDTIDYLKPGLVKLKEGISLASNGSLISIDQEEHDRIEKELLNGKDGLEKEIGYLTTAVRDLWNLLRARLH